MSGTAVDNILQRLRRHESAQSSEASARFLVTKLSWRGNYRRILAITPTGIVTQHPESLSITNAWSFTGDHDLAAIEVGGDHADGGTLVLHFRKDKKGLKSRDAKFACKDRAALLEALYRAVAAATIRGSSGLGPSLLGPPDLFSAYKLRRGEWRAVQLRVTATAVERIDPASGTVKWRWRYSTAASPAARLLAPGDAPPGYAPFALFGKVGRSPRVYACRDADGLLRAVQTAALRKLGLELAVDVSGGGAVSGSQLLSMVAAAERERATTPEEAPLGEWEVLRVRDMHAMGEMPAGDPTVSAVVGTGRLSGGDAAMVVPRRLVLTPNGILERRPATYEVAEWRHLPSVAALVRYAEDPQWLGVEWCDGAPTSIYITPARDTVVAALLYAVQNAAGRPVPVLSGPTGGGDPIVAQKGQAPGAQAVLLDPEIERAMVAQLATAAAEFIEAGGPELSLNSLALAGLTAATTTAMAPVPGAGEGEGARTGSEDKDGLAMRAIAGLEQRIRQFNASVAYSGVPPGEDWENGGGERLDPTHPCFGLGLSFHNLVMQQVHLIGSFSLLSSSNQPSFSPTPQQAPGWMRR